MKNIRSIKKLFPAILLAAALAFSAPLLAADIESELGEKEIKMGAEAAADIAKELKLSDNASDLKRIREIGEKIAAIANSKEIPALYGSSKVTPFQYTFNIVEEDDINAFSVPGGHIYIYRGLLSFVQSDHELAAVIAHEITHAAHHHMVYLLKKQASLNNLMAIALVAALMGGNAGRDIGNIAMGIQLYSIAKLNGYGMEAERDADRGAIIYMKEAGYNPVGLLTFMERLARKPELVDLGIYRSHPLDAERVKAAKAYLDKLGIPINRRATTNAISAEVKTEQIDGKDIPQVVIKDKVIIRPAPADGKTALQRADDIAERINQALDSGVRMHELRVEGNGVVARDKVLLIVTEADAKLMGKSAEQIAKEAGTAIRNVIWKQMVETMH